MIPFIIDKGSIDRLAPVSTMKFILAVPIFDVIGELSGADKVCSH